MKKYHVFVGNYGSGKTELAIHHALMAAEEGKETMLVDMDIVNPYFRSSEKSGILERQGVQVIQPYYANTTVDVPALPPEIFAPFDKGCDYAVFDSGGDPVGAAALGLLVEKFRQAEKETEILYIINTLRPMQGNAEDIIQMLHEIQEKSKLKVTALVNNTNLARETEPEHVIEGQRLVETVGKKTGIPVAFACAKEEIFTEVQEQLDCPVKKLHIYMRPEWLDQTR